MDDKTFYITTTLPYVNATPHVGFASEIIVADARARWERAHGATVFFNTGTDEHGVKIWQKAQDEGKDVQTYVDEYAAHFGALRELLDLSYTDFIRTTDARHIAAAQELWRRVDAAGYIYKKHYQVKYCVGCELEKTDSELVDGQCEFHPGKPLEIIEEENYFFRFSAFAERLLALYDTYPDFVVPATRFNEIRSFVAGGLQDFSVSRVAAKMPWGIPVPGDPPVGGQVMYVWFDALTNYISTLGWPEDAAAFDTYWGTVAAPRAVQIAGKDNLRQQSAMWQAMLLAAGLPTSRQIFINGFIGVDGQKMSKSLGNVIAPSDMVARYGTDGTRYLLLTKGTFGEDSDITWAAMDATYNADLANGLGNLVSRIVTLAGDMPAAGDAVTRAAALDAELAPLVARMEWKGVAERVWQIVRDANRRIEETKPWELRTADPARFAVVMGGLLDDVTVVAAAVAPLLPTTAERIARILTTREREVLFARVTDVK